MPGFFRSNTPLIVLILLFVLAEIIVHPTGDYPLNDDWSYAHTVSAYLTSGKFDLGYWPAMTLYAHVWTGIIFCKIFGYSCFVLRLSTLFLTLLAIILFFRLCMRMSGDKRTAFLLTAFLVFNPLEFSLANTFMTDSSFVFSLVLILYFAERYFRTEDWKWLLALSISCVYSVLIRQYGIAAGLSLAFMVFFTKGWQRLLALIPLLVSLMAFFLLDRFIRNSHPGSGFVSADSVLNRLNGDLFMNSIRRLSYLLAYTALFLLPFNIALSIHWFKKQNRKQLIFVLPLFLLLWWGQLKFVDQFLLGNVFGSVHLGTETLFKQAIESPEQRHIPSEIFTAVLFWISRFALVFMNFIVASGLVIFSSRLFSKSHPDLLKTFIFLMMGFTILLIFITETFFDRYWLPLLPLVAAFMAFYPLDKKWLRSTAVSMLLVTACFSVFATRDYFGWNDARWQLLDRAIKKGAEPFGLNAGFEYYGYRFHDGPWWGAFTNGGAPAYIAFERRQYYEVKDYEVYQRIFPFRKDTLFYLVNVPAKN